jgi:hypothetical protein
MKAENQILTQKTIIFKPRIRSIIFDSLINTANYLLVSFLIREELSYFK